MPFDLTPVIWAAVTLAIYVGARVLHRRMHRWWTAPLLVTYVLCLITLIVAHVSYREYLVGTHWLGTLLGPATIAFALPIYQRRELIRRHVGTLAIGIAAGTAAALLSSWGVATLLRLSPDLLTSLLPRSLTMPFATAVSQEIGGLPELTATFVAITGVFGAAVGGVLVEWLPLRSSFARGSLLGLGAHGAGTARAYEIGSEEGAIASLVMVMAGLVNVIGAAVVMTALGH